MEQKNGFFTTLFRTFLVHKFYCETMVKQIWQFFRILMEVEGS